MSMCFEDKTRALHFARACGARGWPEHLLAGKVPAQFLGEAHDEYEAGHDWSERRRGRFNPLLVSRIRRFVARLVGGRQDPDSGPTFPAEARIDRRRAKHRHTPPRPRSKAVAPAKPAAKPISRQRLLDMWSVKGVIRQVITGPDFCAEIVERLDARGCVLRSRRDG